MTLSAWFWIIFILYLLFSGGWCCGPEANRRYFGIGGGVVLAILLGLLGWGAFGPPLK
jgi:hypothetical protein